MKTYKDTSLISAVYKAIKTNDVMFVIRAITGDISSPGLKELVSDYEVQKNIKCYFKKAKKNINTRLIIDKYKNDCRVKAEEAYNKLVFVPIIDVISIDIVKEMIDFCANNSDCSPNGYNCPYRRACFASKFPYLNDLKIYFPKMISKNNKNMLLHICKFDLLEKISGRNFDKSKKTSSNQ